jgi:hypothetical protein
MNPSTEFQVGNAGNGSASRRFKSCFRLVEDLAWSIRFVSTTWSQHRGLSTAQLSSRVKNALVSLSRSEAVPQTRKLVFNTAPSTSDSSDSDFEWSLVVLPVPFFLLRIYVPVLGSQGGGTEGSSSFVNIDLRVV